MKKQRRVSLRRQAGHLLLTTAAGLGVLAVAQVGTTRYMIAKAYDAKGTAIGRQMADIQGMLDAYVAAYYSQLQLATPVVAGVVNPMAPTVTELQNLGLPNTATLTAPAGGGTYQIRISLSPTGCSGPSCNVRAKVWLDTPLTTETGTVDLRVLGAAVAAGTGGMGFSLPANPTTIQSSAGWTEANPDPSGRAGILMAVTGYSASGLAGLIRRDGALSATANHNWGGYNLTNIGAAQASTLQATTTVTAGGTISGATVSSNGETYTGGWFRSNNPGTGWYSQAHGVGIYAQDSSWVRSYNNAGIYTGGQMQAGSIQSNGGLTAVGQITAYAPTVNYANNWAMLGYDAYGNANVAPTSHVGSAYLNDAYIRSAGKWVSQIAAGGSGPPLGGALLGGQCSPDRSICVTTYSSPDLRYDRSGRLYLIMPGYSN